jgi:toxin FitB
MAGYLLGANVISETRRVGANPNVTAFISSAAANELFVSALTVGELWKGVSLKRRTDKAAGDQLAEWVQGIETLFANQVLPVDARSPVFGASYAPPRAFPSSTPPSQQLRSLMV